MVAALTVNDGEVLRITAPGVIASGDCLQLPDGRAGVYTPARSAASGDTNASLHTRGRFAFAKTLSMVVLAGSRLYYDRSTGLVTILRGVGRFYVGFAVHDAASAATTVDVQLNAEPTYVDRLGRFDEGGGITSAVTAGGTATFTGALATLVHTSANEAQRSTLMSGQGVDIDDGPIVEFDLAIFDIGATNSVDINWGLATENHATDFDASAQYVAWHMDGNSLNINSQSKDGTTNVASQDTTMDAVDDTFAFYQMDARDKSNIKLYRNGVLCTSVAPLHLNAFTGTLYAIVHVEKTASTTLADVRVREMRIRTTDVSVVA